MSKRKSNQDNNNKNHKDKQEDEEDNHHNELDNDNEFKIENIHEKTSTRKKSKSTSNGVKPEEEEDKPVRVYADGIYDLFHFGHARSLQQAKLLFPNTYLIVGVCNDEITHKLKGKTVMDHKERAESLRHCKWVDEVVENAPWIVTQEFIDAHRIDYVSHGEDACLDKDGNDVYQFVKDQGKFKTIKRTEGISTSDIILRIVKDYDSYVKRNLKRGYTGKEMNVSGLKEASLKMEEKISQFRSKVRDSVGQLKSWSNENHNMLDFLKRFSKRIPSIMLDSPTGSSPRVNGTPREDDHEDDEDDLEYDQDNSLSPNYPRSPPTLSGLTKGHHHI